MKPARTSNSELASEREREASVRVEAAACPLSVGTLFPGAGQFCLGKTSEGAVFSTLGAAELGAALFAAAERDDGLNGFTAPQVGVPLLALQNLWIYSYADALFEYQRAEHLRYVPLDTPAELAVAPFNLRVLAHSDVWLAILLSVTAGFGASLLVDEEFDTDHVGDDPKLFGRIFRPGVGYPLAAGVGVGLFSHVAVGEEALFRGLIQSQMAREMTEVEGWIGGSLAFGAAHAPNVLGMSHDEQGVYLALGVPFITVLGSYLGLCYRWHDYSLAAPVALHFWYDFLLSALFYLQDPQNSPVSARIAVPF